jgi:DNA-binding PucR family transcriptional regulator
MEETAALVLRALVDEAPTQDVDAVVRAYRKSIEACGDEGEAAAAEQNLKQLLELRALVERYRRRATELRALFETAGDLSSVRDVEGVLRAIVRRGRQLLRADTAYLMLVDEERRDTYMRVTEGTVSPNFPEIRLPLGIGLGGRVAETMSPHWTADYVRDTRYLHVIDDIVMEESLVAILGVPLKIGRRLLGVLFASDRSPREFSRDEVSLLSSLGDHAAIAIDNAALFQETRDAVAAVEAANHTIENANRQLRLAVDLHERLMSLVLGGGTVQILADVICEVLGGAVLVLDEHRRQLARAGSSETDFANALSDVTNALADDDMTGRSLRFEADSWTTAVTPVGSGRQRFGRLIYVARTIEDVDLRSLERAATTLALLFMNRRANDEADNRVRGELLGELLTPSLDNAEAIVRRAGLMEVDLDTVLVVVVVVPQSTSAIRALHEQCSEVARAQHGLVSALADRLVLLLPAADAGAAARWVAQQLKGEGLEVAVGGSGPLDNLRAVIRHEDRARRAASVLLKLGQKGKAASVEEMGIYGLMMSEVGLDHIQEFVRSTLGQIARYDASRGTALVDTLDAYFGSEGNVAAAAEQMYIHSNTMYQRLERLDRLLGSGWRTGERALSVRLALHFRRLLDRPDI